VTHYDPLRRVLNFKLTTGNILKLTPPLTISKAELDHTLDIVEECLVEIETPNP
jgi:4-aminobutyrate aminotransferase-like enzyme